MPGIRRRFAAFRRWSHRVDERPGCISFCARLVLIVAVVVAVVSPFHLYAELTGLLRAPTLGAKVGYVEQLCFALHEAGHVVVGAALRPDGRLAFATVFDRVSRRDAAQGGYAQYLFPPWPATERRLDGYLAYAEGGNAVDAYGAQDCRTFVRFLPSAFSSDDAELLEDIADIHDLRYRPGWRMQGTSFGADPRWPGEAKALTFYRDIRAIAYGTVEANIPAIGALAVRILFKKPRHGMKVIYQEDLDAVIKQYPLRRGRCDPGP